ncbi:hypothetical protein Dimus_037318 [Dionaea muscipula]
MVRSASVRDSYMGEVSGSFVSEGSPEDVHCEAFGEGDTLALLLNSLRVDGGLAFLGAHDLVSMGGVRGADATWLLHAGGLSIVTLFADGVTWSSSCLFGQLGDLANDYVMVIMGELAADGRCFCWIPVSYWQLDISGDGRWFCWIPVLYRQIGIRGAV